MKNALGPLEFTGVKKLVLLGYLYSWKRDRGLEATSEEIKGFAQGFQEVRSLVLDRSTFKDPQLMTTFIRSLPKLTKLFVGDMEFPRPLGWWRMPAIEPDLLGLQLEELTIRAGAESNQHLLRSIQGPKPGEQQEAKFQASAVTVVWDSSILRNEIEVLKRLLREFGPSIRHLRYQHLNRRLSDCINDLPVESYLQLRTLHIETPTDPSRRYSWITQFVAAIPSPHFQQLTLRISLTRLHHLNSLCLPELDYTLDERVPPVDKLTIELLPTHRFKVAFKDIRSFVLDEMPLTAERGALGFAYPGGESNM